MREGAHHPNLTRPRSLVTRHSSTEEIDTFGDDPIAGSFGKGDRA